MGSPAPGSRPNFCANANRCGSLIQKNIWLVRRGLLESQPNSRERHKVGGVRRVQQYLHPFSEHLLDWFHITMRLTVLQQQTKGLQQELPATGADVAKQLESIKHLLWHGNTPEALERLTSLSIDLSLFREHSAPAAKVANGMADFETYIRNNSEFIPNFGDRWRKGERISTAFVESTINQVVSRRFVKKQQMQWTLRGAHLLLQTRTRVLNNELEATFRQWYPRFRPKAA